MIRSNKIRKAARGQDCTVQLAGVCNYQPETVVGAHLPDESHGMGLKADDIALVFACSACHDAMDGRRHCAEFTEHKDWYLRRALVRTWRKLVDMGVVKIG